MVNLDFKASNVQLKMQHFTTIFRPFFLLLVFVIFSFPSFANMTADKNIDSLKNQITRFENDTSNIHINILISKEFSNFGITEFDSALFYLNKAMQLSERLKYKQWMYNIYDEHAKLFFASGNFSMALEYYFKMLNLLDESPKNENNKTEIQKKYNTLYIAIGTCYFKMGNNAKALDYYDKSLVLADSVYKSDTSFNINLYQMIINNNIGSVYLTNYDLESAESYFEKALNVKLREVNQSNNSSIYNNLGIIYKSKEDYPKAFEFYDKSLKIREVLNDTAGMAQVYNNLGDCYYLVGDYKKSVEILNKALLYSKIKTNLYSQMIAAGFLTRSFEQLGDYKQSLEMQRLYKQLNDSINSNGQIELSAKLELQYLFEKQERENKLAQDLILAEKQSKMLLFMIISVILLFSFIIVVLLNLNQKNKIKRNKLLQESLILESKNLILEKQNLELEKNNLEQELDFRNKELATHVMYLIKKNEFISSISEKLLAINKLVSVENKKWVQGIIREMKSNVDNTVWSEFELRFQQVHGDFYNKLLEKFPDLTPNEKKICAFLSLNMTTKDISSITFQSAKSIQVARTRLRKRLGLKPDENLISFLQQL